jgi:hypothetical protein
MDDYGPYVACLWELLLIMAAILFYELLAFIPLKNLAFSSGLVVLRYMLEPSSKPATSDSFGNI